MLGFIIFLQYYNGADGGKFPIQQLISMFCYGTVFVTQDLVEAILISFQLIKIAFISSVLIYSELINIKFICINKTNILSFFNFIILSIRLNIW